MDTPIKLNNEIYTGAKGRESLFDLTVPTNWNNKLIIFLHGYMGYKDWGCWNLVQAYFNNYEYGFLKYNVSHNGGTVENPIDFSDLEAFSENTYMNEIRDFEAIIEKVNEIFDKTPQIYVIGHSRGGGIALLQSDNGFIKKIATWAAISDIESRFPKDKEFTAWQEDGYYFKRNGRTKQAMPHKFLQYESFEQNKMRLNIQTYCKNSTTPTCVIHGEDDDSVSINEGKKIARWLNKELVVIKEAKHTFGSSQPWRIAVLPNQLKEVCDVTLDFFIEEREKSTPDEKVKLSLLSDLIKLARVDDAFRDAEFKFLVAIAGQLGISNNDFKRLFDQYIEFNPPKMEMDRIIQFQRLILLMNVDLEVMESEIQYVRDIGIKMGLHPDATEEVLVKMKEYPRRVVPPHVLLEIFRTHHN